MNLFTPPDPPRKWSAPRILGLAAGVLVLGLALWLAAYRIRGPAARPPEAARATPPAARAAAPPSTAPSREAPRPRVVATPLPAPLRVEADVAEASVFIDHRFVGKAPVDLRDLTPGTHRLNVSADGFPMQAEEVEVGNEPRTIRVRLSEVRLDESLAVIHKHAVGSCTGVLRATQDGLAFEAAGGKDSFQAPFPDLGRFDVDYLKKTLRLSLRGGRSYNFTVAGQSADPLLVFQQKVDAARKRLKP